LSLKESESSSLFFQLLSFLFLQLRLLFFPVVNAAFIAGIMGSDIADKSEEQTNEAVKTILSQMERADPSSPSSRAHLLRNIAASMTTGFSKILIVEHIIPETEAPRISVEGAIERISCSHDAA
jgi:hypothetical protein